MSTQTKIYIMRHGQCADNALGLMNGRRNSPLTVEGEKQAIMKASQMYEQKLEFGRIFCSPLDRATTTARIIADHLKHAEDLYPLDNLTERSFGQWEGRPFADIAKQVQSYNHEDWRFLKDAPGLESLKDLRNRAWTALRQISLIARPGSTVLVVTHGYTAKAIEAVHYREDWPEVVKRGKLGNCEFRQLMPPAEIIDFAQET